KKIPIALWLRQQINLQWSPIALYVGFSNAQLHHVSFHSVRQVDPVFCSCYQPPASPDSSFQAFDSEIALSVLSYSLFALRLGYVGLLLFHVQPSIVETFL